MEGPAVNRGVAPCFDGPLESGAYFSGHGGYAVIGVVLLLSLGSSVV